MAQNKPGNFGWCHPETGGGIFPLFPYTYFSGTTVLFWWGPTWNMVFFHLFLPHPGSPKVWEVFHPLFFKPWGSFGLGTQVPNIKCHGRKWWNFWWPNGPSRWWQLKYFLFSPRKLGKMNPFWRAYFSKGLVQPPTRPFVKNSIVLLLSEVFVEWKLRRFEAIWVFRIL